MGFWSRLLRRAEAVDASSAADAEMIATLPSVVNHSVPDDPADASRYLSSEQSGALVLDAAGLPPLHLKVHERQYWLAEDTTGLLVNVANRCLRRLGIWSVRVRGTQYHPKRYRLGAVTLCREPDNAHDKNAVAVHAGATRIGYFNKQMAASLARELDRGATLDALMISTNPPKVIAAEHRIIVHLLRNLADHPFAID